VLNGVFSIPLSPCPQASGASAGPTRASEGDFVAGAENWLLQRAIVSVLESTAAIYNPLVLYGPSGCGKTHVVRGLAQWWKANHPGASVVMLGGGEFAEHFASAVERQQMAMWRSQIRHASLLIIDDLGQLSARRTAQQELWHTLDVLWQQDALVVVTTRSLPHHMPTLLPALRSRLVGGLAVPIALPGEAVRRELLLRFAADRGMTLTDAAAAALAERLRVPAVGLLAALMEIEVGFGRTNIDVGEAHQYLAEHHHVEPPTLHNIASMTAKYFGLKVSDIKSPRRPQTVVASRGVAMYLARKLTGKSLEQIGAHFGGRDHTTVLHACRRTEKLIKEDLATREAVAALKRLLLSA